MKKTAVEWMANELLYLDNEYDMKFIDKNEYQIRRKQIIEQAKEMEESVTKTAYEVGIARGMSYDEEIYHKNNWWSSEQYYNETFKSEE
jgi:hypothetical protein